MRLLGPGWGGELWALFRPAVWQLDTGLGLPSEEMDDWKRLGLDEGASPKEVIYLGNIFT